LPASIDKNIQHSTLRERIIGDALRILWDKNITNVEVFRSEFDAHGYDLAMAQRDIIWIQITLDLKLGPYYWFWGHPGKSATRDIRISKFDATDTK
jgi:hypothetical protein